jgi:hypothetical protein
VGETRVDIQHLLEDIRDAYPGSLEETIVTEIVANSLDSGAALLHFEVDAANATLTVVDDGCGMARRELARYHDIAASSKSRGEGIGFAGVGIKLGILAAEEVFTETRRATSHVATSWGLTSRHRAPWHWTPPLDLVRERGTAVRLKLRNPLSPLLDAGFLESTLTRHFEPLLDPTFNDLLSDHYPEGVRFVVSGRILGKPEGPAHIERALLTVRVGRKRKPAAIGFLVRGDDALPEGTQGLTVSTLGKVIKQGWEWLGFSPQAPDRVGGLVEVPALAECLTLNKADFIRIGSRGAIYLACRKALQEAVSAQLAAWGDAPDTPAEESRRRKARPVERDLAAVLLNMADDFPLIASLVEKRAGGQKRLPIANAAASKESPPDAIGFAEGSAMNASADSPIAAEAVSAAPPETAPNSTPLAPDDTPPAEEPASNRSIVDWPGAVRRRKPARLGLGIQFESRPDDPNLGRLVESTVRVNEAHPAYQRAVASRADGYHLALTVALVLAPLAVEPAETHEFLTAFLARWGEEMNRPRHRGTGRTSRTSGKT